MTTVVVALGAFFMGVVVGAVFDDAWRLYRSSRRERHMKSGLPKLTTTHLLLAAVAFNTVLGVMLYLTGQRVAGLEDANRANAVTQCENANEARAANLTLWTYVLDLSSADREDPPTAAEQEWLAEFRAWVAELYAPRDCSDLSQRYEVPPPPSLPPGP